MFNGYNETPNFYNQGLFDNCSHSGLLSGEMSKHASAPPWDYPPQPYNNLQCYTGQQHLPHRQLPLIHNQVVSSLEKKENSFSGTNGSHNYGSSSVHQPVVKPTALINCQANCNACFSHSNRVPHWNPSSESVRYLDHAALSKELPRYPHGVPNFPSEDARFVGDFGSTFDKLPFFPRDSAENLSHGSVSGTANKKEFAASLLHDSHQQNTIIGSDLESVKKEKCTKCRGICRSNCKLTKQQSSVKHSNQEQHHVSRENVARYPGHHPLNSTAWPISSQAQSGMWFQNAQSAFWMSHNEVPMSAGNSFGYWANNEDMSSNISLHHGRPGMQNTSRYPVHPGSQENVTLPAHTGTETETNKFKAMASYQDSYKQKCAEMKVSSAAQGEILRKELQEPLQNNKNSKRIQTPRLLDMGREFPGRNFDMPTSSQGQDVSKTSVYDNSSLPPYIGDDASKLYGATNSSNSIRTNAANFTSYPFVNVNNGYGVGLPQSLSQFNSHIPYNQAKLESGSNYVNNLQYPNSAPVGPFIQSQLENNHNSYVPSVAKAGASNSQPVPNSCIQYSPSKKSAGDFVSQQPSQQPTTHPVSDVIKYNFTNSANEPSYSMLQSCNKMSENVSHGKTMQMVSGPDSCAEKTGPKTNPYYFSNVAQSSNSMYPGISRNVHVRPPFRFDAANTSKETASCEMYCDGPSDSRTASNFQYESSQLQNSSNTDVSPSAHVGDSCLVQVDLPFVSHSPVSASRPIKKRRPRPKGTARSEQLQKGPILDVRQYLATWDEESDDVTTMHRLPDGLSGSSGTCNGLVALNNSGARQTDPGLGLVPMYNELADEGSECSSVHSENGPHSCQHASMENLTTETLEIPKTSSGCGNHSDQRRETMLNNGEQSIENMLNGGERIGVGVVGGNNSDKSIGTVDHQISPVNPRMQAQSLDHNSSASPGVGHNLANLQTHTHSRYSSLENDYLSPDELNSVQAECSEGEYLNETKSPVIVTAAQSFDSATVLLSEDNHDTLSPCDLVSEMQIAEVVPVSRSVEVPALHDGLPIGASRAEVVQSSRHQESYNGSITDKNEPFIDDPKTFHSEAQPCLTGASFVDGNDLQPAEVSIPERVAVNSEGASVKDTDESFHGAKQLEGIQLYSGRDESAQATDRNSSAAASQNYQALSSEQMPASTAQDMLKSHENDREVFISDDMQFPDLSYGDSDGSVDGDMQTGKSVFAEGMSLPRSAHDNYSEKHSDSSFIKSFVNEIASNIPNFDNHLVSGHPESSCVDSRASSDKKTPEKKSEAPFSTSECEVLVPPSSGTLSEYLEHENCEGSGNKYKLQGQISCKPFTKLEKHGTVITSANCSVIDCVGRVSTSNTVKVKKNGKRSVTFKKNCTLKPLSVLTTGNNIVVSSHFAKQKIKLRTREAKSCHKRLLLKNGNLKPLSKKRKNFGQNSNLNKNKLCLSLMPDKSKSSDVIQLNFTGNGNETYAPESKVTSLRKCNSEVSLYHQGIIENNTPPASNNKVISDHDMKLQNTREKCEETELAVNLVLETAKYENFFDVKNKNDPESSKVRNLSNHNVSETSRIIEEPKVSMLCTSFVDDGNQRSCEGDKDLEEVAVDLRVSKRSTIKARDDNVYHNIETSNCIVFGTSSKESSEKMSAHRKSTIFSYANWNFTSRNAPSHKDDKVRTFHEAGQGEPGVPTNEIHAQWQDSGMWNQCAVDLQKCKPFDERCIMDADTACSGELRTAAERERSVTPVQVEALDLCKHNFKEEQARCIVVKETAGTRAGSRNLEQWEHHSGKLEPSPVAVEASTKNGSAADPNLSYSLHRGFEERCSTVGVPSPERVAVLDNAESQDLVDAGGVMTVSANDNDSTIKTLCFDSGRSCTEGKSIVNSNIYKNSTPSHAREVPEQQFCNVKGTENCTPINYSKERVSVVTSFCQEAEQSAPTRDFTRTSETLVVQDVHCGDGELHAQEGNCESSVHISVRNSVTSVLCAVGNSIPESAAPEPIHDDVKTQDAPGSHEFDDNYDGKLPSVHSKGGHNQLELADVGSECETEILRPLVKFQGHDANEPQEHNDSMATGMRVADNYRESKQLTAMKDNLHSTSRNTRRENVSVMQHSDNCCENRGTSSIFENSRQIDFSSENVCRREFSVLVSAENRGNEQQIQDERQKNEAELEDDNVCSIDTRTPDRVQIQETTTTCTSPEYEHSYSEGVDSELVLERHSTTEIASDDNSFEQAESYRLDSPEVVRLDSKALQGSKQELHSTSEQGRMMLTDHSSGPPELQGNNFHEMEICTPPNVQNETSSQPHIQEVCCEMERATSDGNQDSDLPCSLGNSMFKPTASNVEEGGNTDGVQNEGRNFRSEAEISVRSEDFVNLTSGRISTCEPETSAPDTLSCNSTEMQQPQESFLTTTAAYDRGFIHSESACDSPSTVELPTCPSVQSQECGGELQSHENCKNSNMSTSVYTRDSKPQIVTCGDFHNSETLELEELDDVKDADGELKQLVEDRKEILLIPEDTDKNEVLLVPDYTGTNEIHVVPGNADENELDGTDSNEELVVLDNTDKIEELVFSNDPYENEPVVPDDTDKNKLAPDDTDENELVVPDDSDKNELVVIDDMDGNELVVIDDMDENELVVIDDMDENELVIADDTDRNEQPVVPDNNDKKELVGTDDPDKNELVIIDDADKNELVTDDMDENEPVITEDTDRDKELVLSYDTDKNELVVTDGTEKNELVVTDGTDRNTLVMHDNTEKIELVISDDTNKNELLVNDTEKKEIVRADIGGNEDVIVSGGTTVGISELIDNHVYKHEFCTNDDLQNEHSGGLKQGCSQMGGITCPSDKHLKVGEANQSVSSQYQDDSEPHHPDVSFTRTVSSSGRDATEDNVCSAETSSPSPVQDTVIGEHQPVNNTRPLEIPSPNPVPNCSTVDQECGNPLVDETNLPCSSADVFGSKVPKNKFHDHAQRKPDFEVICGLKAEDSKFGDDAFENSMCSSNLVVISDCGSQNVDTSFLNAVEETSPAGNTVYGRKSTFNGNQSKLTSSLDYGALDNGVMDSQGKVQRSGCKNSSCDNREIVNVELHVEPVLADDEAAQPGGSKDFANVFNVSRSVPASESSLSNHACSHPANVLMGVSGQSHEKLINIPATGGDVGSVCELNEVRLLRENNKELIEPEGSRLMSASEGMTEYGGEVKNKADVIKKLDKEFVNVDTLENCKIPLPDEAGVAVEVSNSSDRANNLAEDEANQIQKIEDGAVIPDQISEKDDCDLQRTTPLSESALDAVVQNDCGAPVRGLESVPVKLNVSSFKDVKILENGKHKEFSSEISLKLRQSELQQPNTLCNENDQVLEENDKPLTNNTTFTAEVKEREFSVISCFTDCDGKDSSPERCSAEKTSDISSKPVSAKCVSYLNKKQQNCDYDCDYIDQEDSVTPAEHNLQHHMIINKQKQITVYPTISTHTHELCKRFDQQNSSECEVIEKMNACYPNEDDCDDNVVSSTSEKSVGECQETQTVQAALLSNDELVEGQIIIIQNSSDDVTSSMNLSAESLAGVNSVCLEGLEHVDDNEDSNVWPVIVETDEATQIFIAVAEGNSDESAENEMPCLEVEPGCLNSPEMPHLEVMTKNFESDGSDQDLEMPVLDVNTSATADGSKATRDMPVLESVVISSDVELRSCAHSPNTESCHCCTTLTKASDIPDSQHMKPDGNQVVLEANGGMRDEQEVVQVDNPCSPLKQNLLSSTEVGNIFPMLASENIEQSFHCATHIIPAGDSVSNWPYLEEEVPSEILPSDPETTIPLSETPCATTVVASFSPNSYSEGSSRVDSIIGSKFRVKGWHKKRILYYYNSQNCKPLIRKKCYLNWNRICARSKIDKSKSFKVNKINKRKISPVWPRFSRSPTKWLQNKTKRNLSTSEKDFLAEENDSCTKIEVRLSQKCERVDGVKTWCVVGTSEMKNDHSWSVIEENNNVMTSGGLSKTEDKVPIVLVKRLVLKKSNGSSIGTGTQEYTVKPADCEVSSAANEEDNSRERNVCSEIPVHQGETVETPLPERLTLGVASKECSLAVEGSKGMQCQGDLSSVMCTVCDSNTSTLSPTEHCKKHFSKQVADSCERVPMEEHQVSSNSAHHVPRVIIKRTGPGGAKYQSFLRSSPGGSHWQPVVQLVRSKVLDNLVRNVLEVGSVKKVISLSDFRLVLGKRSDASSQGAAESNCEQAETVLEPLQTSSKSQDEEIVSVGMQPDDEKEKTVKNASSCKYVVLENNTKDTLLTFQRQKSESEAEEQKTEQNPEQFKNGNRSPTLQVTSSKAKEVSTATEISDGDLPGGRNRNRKCKAVFTYMESSSEDSQENSEMLPHMVKISRKRSSENEDRGQMYSDVCNKRLLISGEAEAGSIDNEVLATSGKRKHSVCEGADSSRKKAHLARYNSSSSIEDLCGAGCSPGGSMEDGAGPGFAQRIPRRPRSLRCKNVAIVLDEDVAPDACRVCGYVFLDEEDKADHVKQHPYHCQRCHLAFQSKMDFRNHLSVMHPRTKEQHHCLLCERTFPTAARHRVHLTGRQHCYLEMTQRRTIHTLFKLFTSEFCPALPPPTREELAGLSWFPSEPGTIHFYHQATPLQLAVQDLMWRRRQLSGSSSESVPAGPQGS